MQEDHNRSNPRLQTLQDDTTQMGTSLQPIHTQAERNGPFSNSPMEPIYSYTRNGQAYNYLLISQAYRTQIERNGPTWNSTNGLIRRYINMQTASNEQSPNLLGPQRNGQPSNLADGPSINLNTTSERLGQYSPMEPTYRYTRSGAVYGYPLISQSAQTQIERNGQPANSTNVPIWHSSIPTQIAGYTRSGAVYNYNLISQAYHTQIESARPSSNSANGIIGRYTINPRNASSNWQDPLSTGQSSNPTDFRIGNSVMTLSASGHGQSSNSAASGDALAAWLKKQLEKRRNPIFKLPTRSIPQEELDEMRCAICFRDAKDFKELRRPVAKTICGHFYCVPCIYKWEKSSGNCPMCRQRVLRRQNGKILFHLV